MTLRSYKGKSEIWCLPGTDQDFFSSVLDFLKLYFIFWNFNRSTPSPLWFRPWYSPHKEGTSWHYRFKNDVHEILYCEKTIKDNYASNLTEYQRNDPSRMHAFNRAFHSILFFYLHWLSNKEHVEACMKDDDKIH